MSRHRSRTVSRSDVVAGAEPLSLVGSASHAHARQTSTAPNPSRKIRAMRGGSGDVLHLFADMRDAAGLDRAKLSQQLERRGNPIRRRAIEPLEVLQAATCGENREHQRRQVDAMNLGLAMRPQPIARIPQPSHEPGTEAGGAAGALIGAVERDALGREGIDAAIGVVAGDLLQSGIDHRRHATDGQRRFRDVGGDDDPAAHR